MSNLRKDMWQVVERLRETGVTIILTTHYIEEAEEIADRVGVINGGKILLIEQKKDLMKQARAQGTARRSAGADLGHSRGAVRLRSDDRG